MVCFYAARPPELGFLRRPSELIRHAPDTPALLLFTKKHINKSPARSPRVLRTGITPLMTRRPVYTPQREGGSNGRCFPWMEAIADKHQLPCRPRASGGEGRWRGHCAVTRSHGNIAAGHWCDRQGEGLRTLNASMLLDNHSSVRH